MARRIDDVMVNVVNKMNDITEHLRDNNFGDSADRIARNVHEMINVFTNTVMKFNDDQMIMYPPRAHPAVRFEGLVPPTLSRPISRNAPNENGGPGRLYSEVAAQPIPQPIEYGSPPIVIHSSLRPAKVAQPGIPVPSRPSSSGRSSNNTIITSQLRPVVPVGHPPMLESTAETGVVLTVIGDFSRQSLNFLTSKIREGPLVSVEINYAEGMAEITFQKSVHAVTFLDQERTKRAKTGTGLFGASYQIVYASEFGWCDEVRRMESKPRERRRLTFARAGLLGGQLSVKRILNDMAQAVGAEGVEFVWAFNTGNVTAVFKSVALARAIRDHFMALAAHKSSPYYGVQISFSTDPCEKQLNLDSQIGIPQSRRTKPARPGRK